MSPRRVSTWVRLAAVAGLVVGLAGATVACGGDGGNGGSSYSIDAAGPAGSVSLPVADKTQGMLTEEDARDVLSSFNRLVAAVDSGDTLLICKAMPSWMRPGIENATLLVRNPGRIAGCASYLANAKRAMEPFRVGDFRRFCRLVGWPGVRVEGGQPAADVACLRFVKAERRKAVRAWPAPFTDPARFAALQYRFGFDRVFVFSKAVPERIALYRQSPSGGSRGVGPVGFATVRFRHDPGFEVPARFNPTMIAQYVKEAQGWRVDDIEGDQ